MNITLKIQKWIRENLAGLKSCGECNNLYVSKELTSAFSGFYCLSCEKLIESIERNDNETIESFCKKMAKIAENLPVKKITEGDELEELESFLFVSASVYGNKIKLHKGEIGFNLRKQKRLVVE